MSYLLEICQGFLAKGLLYLDAVGPMVLKRLENGELILTSVKISEHTIEMVLLT